MVDQKRFGLLMGVFVGAVHLLWVLAVALIPTTFQQFINRVCSMHFMSTPMVLLPFNFGKAVLLVVITFIIGTIIGNIIGMILNASMNKH